MIGSIILAATMLVVGVVGGYLLGWNNGFSEGFDEADPLNDD